jgi:hypothetical protein
VALPNDKEPSAVKSYFEKAYPEIDFERVYASDMKKMVKWFDILKKNNVDIKLSEPEETEEPETADVAAPEEEEEKPAPKKRAPKKAATKKEPSATKAPSASTKKKG